MFLAALANMGGFFAAVTQYIYHSLCCCGSCKSIKVDKETKRQTVLRMVALWRSEKNAPNASFLVCLEDSDSDNSESDEEEGDNQEGKLVPIPISLLLLLRYKLHAALIWNIVILYLHISPKSLNNQKATLLLISKNIMFW